MPAVATGANAANSELYYVGVSGDGDSLSIGLRQMCHAIRRNVSMLYVLENNGVYGLTKGQFSASADLGSKSKKGEPNAQPPIDPVLLALTLGASFVARSFSGDKAQLVPILKAGIQHRGFALAHRGYDGGAVPGLRIDLGDRRRVGVRNVQHLRPARGQRKAHRLGARPHRRGLKWAAPAIGQGDARAGVEVTVRVLAVHHGASNAEPDESNRVADASASARGRAV